VVCRAGATTISELTAIGLPAVYLPFPAAADDHQTHNARAVVEAGGGLMVTDAELLADPAAFSKTLAGLLADRHALEEMGAVVTRYADPVVKYHAKYLVADESTAVITTLNPTKKCFTHTWDAVLITPDPSVVKGLLTLFKADGAGVPLPSRRPLGRRLIVGPERSRAEIRGLIAGAKHSIRILDHKLSDPDLVALLRERRAEGITVTVLGKQPMRGVTPHGKMLIVDETRAVLGSTALSTLSLDFRREVSVVVHEPALVKQLNMSYQQLTAKAGAAATHLPGDRIA
ncbi:MAG: hypothetical protein EBY17_23815, partial [Acidobacteriia bacterium]|nr:hypothetical protein [Terriglobia bacterium]